MPVVLRKDARFVRPALQAPDAGPDGKLVHIDPLHVGPGAARFIRHDLEEGCRHPVLPGAAIEKKDHSRTSDRVAASVLPSDFSRPQCRENLDHVTSFPVV
jgi:hypothetical protein